MPTALFDAATLRKLDRLALVATRVRAGVMKGERRSTRRGTSIEFADYREYSRGDDLRRIDWNVFARLDRPFIKLLEEEEDLAVHILIDASGSMNWPNDETTPDQDQRDAQHKFTFARRIAAGLGHIALGTGDRLTVSVLRGDQRNAGSNWGPHRGRAFSLDLLRFLEPLTASGDTDLNTALRQYAARSSRAGLCVVISDLLTPGAALDGLGALVARGYELALIHVLSPDEVNPPLTGDLRLVDSETSQGRDVTVDAGLRTAYMNRLLAWRGEIGDFCGKRGIHYATVETGGNWEALILYELRRLGVVR
jgi:uncharacterized protein (DUF58 family)